MFASKYLPTLGNIFPLGVRNLSLAMTYDSSILSLTNKVPAQQQRNLPD